MFWYINQNISSFGHNKEKSSNTKEILASFIPICLMIILSAIEQKRKRNNMSLWKSDNATRIAPKCGFRQDIYREHSLGICLNKSDDEFRFRQLTQFHLCRFTLWVCPQFVVTKNGKQRFVRCLLEWVELLNETKLMKGWSTDKRDEIWS